MADLVGQQLGNYTLTEVIGRGGMATIYRATIEPFTQDVAIKVLAVELAGDPDFTHRFRREAAVVAQMEHPHILRVLDFGEQGRYVYIVMPLITGGDLYNEMDTGPLSLNRVARVLSQIASALTYAHTQDVVHRDLKPENVLLDEQRNAYLTDFGIAKMMAGTSHITATGMLMGTPAYMAPEQWRTEPIDGRTDVYALGMMLYEMLVGVQPFEADSPFALMYEHLDKLPTSPLRYHPNLPAAIEPVIYKAIAKTPNNRYPTPTALSEAFTAVVTRAPNPDQRVTSPKKRLPPQREGLQTDLDKSTLDLPIVPRDQLPSWALKLKGAPQVARDETPPSSPTPSQPVIAPPATIQPPTAVPAPPTPSASPPPPAPSAVSAPSPMDSSMYAPPPPATTQPARRRPPLLIRLLGGMSLLNFVAVIAITGLLLMQDEGDGDSVKPLSTAQQTGTAVGAAIGATAEATVEATTETPQITVSAPATQLPAASDTPTPTPTSDSGITIITTPATTPDEVALLAATATPENTLTPPATVTVMLTATPTMLPTNTPKPTHTATGVPTASPSPVPTDTPTQPPTNTPKPTVTATHTPAPTATHTAPPPTATHTVTPEPTLLLPTATATHTATPEPTIEPTLALLPSATLPPPSATNTGTPAPTAEPTRVATSTPPPTLTPAVTATLVPTEIPARCLASPSGTGAVNLRSGPGGGFAVLNRLLPDDSLPVLLRSDTGYVYVYDGWTHETVVDLSPTSACADVPIIQAQASDAAAVCTVQANVAYADLPVDPDPLTDRAYLAKRNTPLTVFRLVTGTDG
ncbi:MAG: protein kinase, partial [Anaerolineae bacterium]|nr:protein kinase [Anaerolineae bacterium]